MFQEESQKINTLLKSSYTKDKIEAGCDEAGRGCMSGPVFAAAVILPKKFKNELLNDSKKLSKKNRYLLREIIEKEAVAFAVYKTNCQIIDKINILNASILSMQNAVKELAIKPELLLIDGNRFKPFDDYKYECIIKGDSIYSSIAAASILAKTYRDDYMLELHKEFPNYKWNNNKGYGTKEHKEAMLKYGLTKYHRKTFNFKSQQLSLDF